MSLWQAIYAEGYTSLLDFECLKTGGFMDKIKKEAQFLVQEMESKNINLTRIRAIADETGKNTEIADCLWASGGTRARLLSLLLLDLKNVDEPRIDSLIADIEMVSEKDQVQLSDWLLSNVIMKKNQLKKQVAEWISEESIIKQRLYWQFRAKTIRAEEKEMNLKLLDYLESHIAAAHKLVQWTMNWCIASIGIQDETLRNRCISIGEKNGLYKDYPVSKGCTSPYLPIWINAVVNKKNEK